MFSLLQEAATTAVETTEGAIVIDDAATHGVHDIGGAAGDRRVRRGDRRR